MTRQRASKRKAPSKSWPTSPPCDPLVAIHPWVQVGLRVTSSNPEVEAIGPSKVVPDPEALRSDGGDDVGLGGVLTDYLLRWNGEYFGVRSNGNSLLLIDRETALNGEINSCDLLVVEGKVEASMKGCREIKITETGTVKGQIEFERADISGVFEGDLTASERLVVRATGRVTGKVRIGELEVERGGQVLGDIQVFGNGAAAGQQEQGAVEKLAN